MGLFSKIKKGFKKVVSGIAKGIKKVAKGVVTALPGGQKLWKKAGKLGKKIMKGVAKLGPVGLIAIQALLSVTGVGAAAAGMLGSMWSGFGAAAASAAASTSALVSAIGTAGTGLFAGGNFIAGTLGAMGNAIAEGASQLASGNFSAAASAFGTNMGAALSGEAGMASVNAAAAQAAASAGELLGQSIDATQAVQAGIDPSFAAENLGKDALGFNPSEAGKFDLDSFLDVSAEQSSGITAPSFDGTYGAGATGVEEIAQKHMTGKVGELTFAEQGALNDYGTKGVEAIQPDAMGVADQNQAGAKKVYDALGNLVSGGGAENIGGGSLISRPSKSKSIQSAQVGGGQGSEGFSLLKGVQGLEQSLRNSQNLMFT